MELPTVESVVTALAKRNIRTNVGNPGSLMPHLERAVVAVNLKESTMTERTMVAYICGPQHIGHAACENLATRVALFWTADGAKCEWGEYSFDGKSAMHIVKVYGTWSAVEQE